jgi:branched-chain amino acid transport system substrate-binding protein
LLGGLDPVLNERLARSLAPSGVPLLLAGGPPEEPQGEGVYALGAAPAYRGQVLGRFAAAERKATRAAVLLDGRDPAASALSAAFLREWRRGKDAQAAEAQFGRDADAPDALAGLLKAKPQVLLLAVAARDFARLRQKAAAELGPDAALLYGGEDQGTEALGLDATGPEVYLATVYCEEKLTREGRDFAQRYEKAFRAPPDLAAAQAYDGVRLLFEALSKAGPTPAKVREYLSGLEDWPSVTGPLSLKERRTRRPVFVVRLQGGAAKLARAYPREGEEKTEGK